MVVLAAGVTTKSGKLLLSRQFVNFSRVRIEGLLASFPKLVSSDQQHTYVETDNVRYVFQPVESLYVLLITTKSSNIVEDLETLSLLAKVLPEYSPRYGVVDEETVIEASFEIICSFDEVIDWGGARESVNLQQIATFTEMYSHEERLAKMIQESKMQEAKEEMKRKAAAIRSQRGDGDRLGIFGAEIGRVMNSAGLGGLAQDLGLTGQQRAMMGDAGAGSGRSGISSASYAAQQQALAASDPMASMGSGGGFGGGMGSGAFGGGSSGISSSDFGGGIGSSARATAAPVAAQAGRGGMSLGKGKKQDSLLAAMRAEGEVVDALPIPARSSAAGTSAGAAPAMSVPTEGVHLSTVEKISVTLNRDGGVESMEVKGDLMLRVLNAEKGAIQVAVKIPNASAAFQLRTHPNIDKALFSSQNVLGLKDTSRSFPVGNPLGILRWRLQSKDESMIPLMVNCWPSENGSESQVNLEFELVGSQELRDVTISVPTHTGSSAPKLVDCDVGDFSYNQRTQSAVWTIARVDSSARNGNLEFTTPLVDPSSFFPTSVSFSSKNTFLQLSIAGVSMSATGEPTTYSSDVMLSTEQYIVA